MVVRMQDGNITRKRQVLSVVSIILLSWVSFPARSAAFSTIRSPSRVSGCFPRRHRGTTRRNNQKYYRNTILRPTALTTTTSLQLSSTSNTFSVLLDAVGSPLIAILVLAFVVLFHEAGHFLAARYFNINVQEFSVGIGPKLLGVTPKQGKWFEGVEFNLRAIPFGGFVRFPENYNVTLVQQMEEEFDKKRKEERKLQKEQQQVIKGKALTIKSSSQTAKQASSSSGVIPIDYYTDPNLLQNRSWLQRFIVLSGGVIFNLILAFLLYFGQATVGNGLPRPIFEPGAFISQEPQRNTPSYGLLHRGDVIVEVNGEPLKLAHRESVLESQQAITDFIREIRSTSEGESIRLGIVPGSSATSSSSVQKISTMKKDVIVTPKKLGDSSQPSIGAMLGPNFITTEYVHTKSVPEAIGLAASEVRSISVDTITTLTKAIRTLLAGGGGTTAVSGPIGVIKIGSDMVRTKDLNAVVFFAAAISINLAVVNSLPFPALDGGQIFFVLGEAITGKKIDQRVQENINAIALLLLLLTSFGTVVGDLK